MTLSPAAGLIIAFSGPYGVTYKIWPTVTLSHVQIFQKVNSSHSTLIHKVISSHGHLVTWSTRHRKIFFQENLRTVVRLYAILRKNSRKFCGFFAILRGSSCKCLCDGQRRQTTVVADDGLWRWTMMAVADSGERRRRTMMAMAVAGR